MFYFDQNFTKLDVELGIYVQTIYMKRLLLPNSMKILKWWEWKSVTATMNMICKILKFEYDMSIDCRQMLWMWSSAWSSRSCWCITFKYKHSKKNINNRAKQRSYNYYPESKYHDKLMMISFKTKGNSSFRI